MELPERDFEVPVPGIIESPNAGIGGLDPTPEEVALEVVEEPTEVESSPSLIIDNDEFQRRVEIIMNAIDPTNENAQENTRRLFAEVHTYLSLFDEGMRQSFMDMQAMGGPFSIIKKMMSRG